jgi:cell wall assembly regulator SMI1
MAQKRDVAQTLANIDPLLDDATRALLRPPAKAASLKKLAKVVLGGKPLPRDLETFFHWHDGQSGVAHIHPGDNRSTMTIDEVIDAWKFLTDPNEDVEGFQKSWVPILSNGAGDHVCFETTGKRAGALVEYWHADDDRDVAFASLIAWAEDVAKELAKQAKKKTTKTVAPKLTLDATKTKWKTRAKPPTKAQVAKLPAGAAFYWERIPANPRRPLAHVFVKIGKNDWRTSRGDTPEEAVTKIQKMFDAPKAPDDSFWKNDDFDVAFNAKEETYDDAVDDPKPVAVHEGVIAIHQR